MKPSPNALLSAAQVPSLLLTDPLQIRYVTGLQVSHGMLLVGARSFTLFLDGRYQEMAMKAGKRPLAIRPLDDMGRAMRTVRYCGFHGEEVTVERLQRWKRQHKNTKFVQVGDSLRFFRRTKDEEEIQNIRQALRITETVLKRIPSVLRSGMTEMQLAWQLGAWARELGADGLSFDPIVAFGSHTSMPHHHPGKRAFRRGHLVLVDVGARYRGYCADRTEMFFTAEPTAKERRAFAAVRAARDAVLKAMHPGVTTHALDIIAREVLDWHGMEKNFLHALGHGVGLAIHEGVSLSQRAANEKLLKNEVVAVEPGVYFPGEFGIRLEKTVIVR